jgi:hypothetical protein
VHCMAGVSRSASVVIGYLMWRDSLSFDQSLQAVKAVRPFIKPNQGFVKQLAEYERLGCQAPVKVSTCWAPAGLRICRASAKAAPVGHLPAAQLPGNRQGGQLSGTCRAAQLPGICQGGQLSGTC